MVKGMNVHPKNNPFKSKGRRQHNFARNVEENVAVAKKAGRTMGTRTKQINKTGQHKRLNR